MKPTELFIYFITIGNKITHYQKIFYKIHPVYFINFIINYFSNKGGISDIIPIFLCQFPEYEYICLIDITSFLCQI